MRNDKFTLSFHLIFIFFFKLIFSTFIDVLRTIQSQFKVTNSQQQRPLFSYLLHNCQSQAEQYIFFFFCKFVNCQNLFNNMGQIDTSCAIAYFDVMRRPGWIFFTNKTEIKINRFSLFQAQLVVFHAFKLTSKTMISSEMHLLNEWYHCA